MFKNPHIASIVEPKAIAIAKFIVNPEIDAVEKVYLVAFVSSFPSIASTQIERDSISEQVGMD